MVSLADKFKNTESDGVQLIVSSIRPVASALNLGGMNFRLAHCFLGVEFFADSEGLRNAVPGAGTATVTVGTINNPDATEGVPDNIIDAAAKTTVSWSANTVNAKVTPNGITVATHWRAIWTGNRR